MAPERLGPSTTVEFSEDVLVSLGCFMVYSVWTSQIFGQIAWQLDLFWQRWHPPRY
jgi:hypothetical protein